MIWNPEFLLAKERMQQFMRMQQLAPATHPPQNLHPKTNLACVI